MYGLGVGPPPCPSPKLGALGLVEVIVVLNFIKTKSSFHSELRINIS